MKGILGEVDKMIEKEKHLCEGGRSNTLLGSQEILTHDIFCDTFKERVLALIENECEEVREALAYDKSEPILIMRLSTLEEVVNIIENV